VLGVRNLAGMAKRPRAETARVFEHLVATYWRIESFDRLGSCASCSASGGVPYEASTGSESSRI